MLKQPCLYKKMLIWNTIIIPISDFFTGGPYSQITKIYFINTERFIWIMFSFLPNTVLDAVFLITSNCNKSCYFLNGALRCIWSVNVEILQIAASDYFFYRWSSIEIPIKNKLRRSPKITCWPFSDLRKLN